MSRLDRHVNVIRRKLFLDTLLASLCWVLLIVLSAMIIALLVHRLGVNWLDRIGRPDIWFYSIIGASVVGAIAYSIYRMPTARQAAVFLDDGLGLKEKFSTA